MRFDLFSSGRLHAALEAAGYPDLPAKRTLQEWIQHDSAPESARRAVWAILNTTKEAAPPVWAERLQERLDEIYESQAQLAQAASRSVIEALAPDDLRHLADEADARLAAELAASQHKSDEPTADQAGEPTAGSQGSTRQRRSKGGRA